MRTCRVLGHDYRFAAEGRTMRWDCDRCGEEGGSKTYATPAEAARYARALDRRDAEDVGKAAAALAAAAVAGPQGGPAV